jgi:ATP-dependent DNA ligase
MIEPLEPMLAVTGEPFDCEDHLYEVKWDGVRCLTAVEKDGIRLWGRKCADYTERYPELDVLGKLPPETVIDGELVVLCNGKADLNAVLRRHQLRSRFHTCTATCSHHSGCCPFGVHLTTRLLGSGNDSACTARSMSDSA